MTIKRRGLFVDHAHYNFTFKDRYNLKFLNGMWYTNYKTVIIPSYAQCDPFAAANCFVQVYGLDEEDSSEFIYADTLIIFSRLPLLEIKRIFTEPKDIFPSDMGERADFSQDFVVGDHGHLFPVINLFNGGYSAYYCWWD